MHRFYGTHSYRIYFSNGLKSVATKQVVPTELYGKEP